jgi:hypothetical protein
MRQPRGTAINQAAGAQHYRTILDSVGNERTYSRQVLTVRPKSRDSFCQAR